MKNKDYLYSLVLFISAGIFWLMSGFISQNDTQLMVLDAFSVIAAIIWYSNIFVGRGNRGKFLLIMFLALSQIVLCVCRFYNQAALITVVIAFTLSIVIFLLKHDKAEGYDRKLYVKKYSVGVHVGTIILIMITGIVFVLLDNVLLSILSSVMMFVVMLISTLLFYSDINAIYPFKYFAYMISEIVCMVLYLGLMCINDVYNKNYYGFVFILISLILTHCVRKKLAD